MLHLLTITDYALIDRIELPVADGLVCLTGETGAGKSIVVDALALLLGRRADIGLIRDGAPQARVEGIFSLDDAQAEAAADALHDAGLTPADAHDIVVVREINQQGRNVCRVNGALVPLRALTALGDHLVDIHGQNQHLPLLNPRTQGDLLDRFAGLAPLVREVADGVAALRALRAERDALLTDAREAARRADMLRFQADEIAAADPQPGEDARLEAERAVAANAERLQSLAAQAYDALYEGGASPAAVDTLSDAAQAAAGIAQTDPAAAALSDEAQSILIQAQELARALLAYRDGVDVDPGRLDAIEERLETLRRLKGKYGPTLEDVVQFGAEAAAALEDIAHSDERAEALAAQEQTLLAGLGARAAELSLQRRDAALRLAAAVEAELAQLAMEATAFRVAVSQTPAGDGVPVTWPDGAAGVYACGPTGVDQVEFQLAAGPAEALHPLSTTASGGETSRIMLALKSVLAALGGAPTLVFDEVDAGIGGRIGAVVGLKLHQIARGRQTLCVTHLPQIAAFADRHIRIVKDARGGRTVTTAETLDDVGIVDEIAHMLGGDGPAARLHAQEMLAHTAAWKAAPAHDAAPPNLAALSDSLPVDTRGGAS